MLAIKLQRIEAVDVLAEKSKDDVLADKLKEPPSASGSSHIGASEIQSRCSYT